MLHCNEFEDPSLECNENECMDSFVKTLMEMIDECNKELNDLDNICNTLAQTNNQSNSL